MTTILPAERSSLDAIMSQLNQGLSQTLPQAAQERSHRALLQQSFNQLNPQGDFMEQLRSIAPNLLTVPGGSQALGELAPLLGKFAENKAYENFIKNQRGRTQNGSMPQQSAQSQQTNSIQQKPQPPTEEDYYRNPQAYSSPESLYPEMSTGPQEQPEMSTPEENAAALDLMDQSRATGKPISYPEALQFVQNQNQNIRNKNELIKRDKEKQKEANRALTQGMVNRAQNSGLIKDPEDVTVAEKLALEAKRLPNENEQWKYVRSGLRKFDENKQKIQRSADIAGPFGFLWRKGMGTYQDKESLIRGIQPAIDEYKKYGLYDELRRDLGEYIGLGPEDTEAAIFPLDKTSLQELSKIPINPMSTRYKKGEEPLGFHEIKFPSEGYELSPERFDTLKNQIYGVIKNNPKINLVSLRGLLNQKNRYAWQDVSKAIEELADEGRFTPDLVQEKQLGIINKPPAPGIMEAFKYILKGTK